MNSSDVLIQGRAAACSPGIVIGKIQKVSSGEFPIPERHIEAERVATEISRFEQAVADSVADFDRERHHLIGLDSQEPLHILDSQRLMLLDADLARKVIHSIGSECINAEWAVHRQIQDIASVFDRINDDYLRARKSDIQHIGQRILSHLTGFDHAVLPANTNEEPLVVAGEDFTPIDVLRLWRRGVAGFISEKGGPSSHSIIVARGVGMTALMGADGILRQVSDGDRIIIDGEQGLWLANPSPATEVEFRALAHGMQNIERDLQAYAGLASRSSDGHPLRLMANLELEEELPQAREHGIEGVGLYRTEFLLSVSEKLPSEDMHYQHYTRVMHAMQGLPVTFRLMDIGGEKPLLFEQFTGHRVVATNPALGLRGIRLLLHNEGMMQEQLRALLRASVHGELQILVPMVSRVEEMQEVRRQLTTCADELGITKLPALGAMIEVPAAVMIADSLAEICDFFSIGTNDLIQYTLAADRADEEVAYLYDTAHPALEPMLRQSVRAAHKAGIPIAMCGELAADPKWTELLMNMGFDSLSMGLHHILPVRKHLASLNYRPDN
ncbi:MAG: phosphoenolpyruvate--protein phosphotransferase [Zetaproteobacteria bacterium CG12_big_fil_rev_8_21_14_0_65_55_1124]|nr:MAG: phosphoenolpyruvate--protein phosphotransferase [Zetaproteobacteria bacterium CG1_02_55_237]PIS19549.1 MAG: phosphoenolpyruvate--protein phosphotransferase [Zetaproteobacteria bacterium CG08_land_8_20_14_0_20_55_17]PIW42350.1 MAG: phosphoenolpyruvate--protein phosphotransferase [Zetaproteobacteria bacterium CG12_big_fil_rev_8_21_14_0_65_55_1124]PIY52849.1 MAG: phosphoenolpyruvate--protein phosphotransferase [Zetaproteobacteria bacterium CG_4_10_14_0_8_um_filter_55_43]PIZ38055.1 MAG: pho